MKPSKKTHTDRENRLPFALGRIKNKTEGDVFWQKEKQLTA